MLRGRIPGSGRSTNALVVKKERGRELRLCHGQDEPARQSHCRAIRLLAFIRLL